MISLKRGTDQKITLPRLRTTDAPPQYLNTAVVTGTLIDPEGTPVEGFVNFNLTYVPDSDGTYLWDLDGAIFMPPVSTLYTLEVEGVQGQYNFRSVYEVSVID